MINPPPITMINYDVAGKYSSGNVQDYHFKKIIS